MTPVDESMSKNESILEFGVKFHGHLGPYLVLGLRMGMTAVRTLKPKDLHELSATVWTKKTPPESCLVDGIQVSSGCTLGKGNINVRKARHISAEFRKGDRRIVTRLSRNVTKTLARLAEPTSQIMLNELAHTLFQMSDRELFVIDY